MLDSFSNKGSTCRNPVAVVFNYWLLELLFFPRAYHLCKASLLTQGLSFKSNHNQLKIGKLELLSAPKKYLGWVLPQAKAKSVFCNEFSTNTLGGLVYLTYNITIFNFSYVFEYFLKYLVKLWQLEFLLTCSLVKPDR